MILGSNHLAHQGQGSGSWVGLTPDDPELYKERHELWYQCTKLCHAGIYLGSLRHPRDKKSCDPCTEADILVCLTCQYAHPIEERVSAKVKSCKSCSQENKKRKADAHGQKEKKAKQLGLKLCRNCSHMKGTEYCIGCDPKTGEEVELKTCRSCCAASANNRRLRTGIANDEKVADLDEHYKAHGVYCPGHTVRGNKGCAYEIGNQESMKQYHEGVLSKGEVCTSFDYHHPDPSMKGGGIAGMDDPDERKEEKERTGTVLLCCSCHRIETNHYHHNASYNHLYTKNKKRKVSDA